ASKILQGELGDTFLPGHAGGGRQHPVRADEIAAVPDAFARKVYRLIVVAPDELGVRGNTAIKCRKWIPRAQAQRAARGQIAFLPPPAIGQHEAVISLRQREVWIESQRQLELGQRVIETPSEEINAAQRVMRPRILTVS